MSSLWTPGGEHEVPRRPETSIDGTAGNDPSGTDAVTEADPSLEDALADALPPGVSVDDLTPEQRAAAAEMVKEMSAARERLLETPATTIVANHAMGLYELAALHLSQEHPDFASASLAIDALAAVTEGLGDRLGEAGSTLLEGLDQLRILFVQLRNRPGTHRGPNRSA